MGRALVLIESLTAALLLVALAAAWASRRRSGPVRWAVPAAVVLVVAVPAAFTVYGMSLLNRMGTVSLGQYLAAIGWTAAFVVGSLVVVPSGLRAVGERAWPVRSLAVAFAAAAVLTAVTVSNLDVAVKSQLAAVRVEAGARAMALATPRSTGEPNAAPVYLRAFAALAPPPEQLPAQLRDQATPWPKHYDRTAFDPADREQKEFLDSQQRGLALLREAAAIPYCAFDRDWSGDTAPVDVPLPELAGLRHAAVLLAYDALARASRGDGDGAADDVAAIFGIARHIRYPLMIDLLAAVKIERIGAQALEDVLALAPPKNVTRLPAGTGEPFREFLRRTFAMEEAWGMAAIVMLATGQARGSPELQEQTPMNAFGEALLDSPVYRVFFLEGDLAAYRHHMRTMRENAARPTPAALDGFEEHDKVIRATRGGGVLSGLLLPAAYRVLYAALDGDATRGLARLALAATAYKAKHGKHPEKLSELVPEFIAEVPPDPYDGRPLRLKRTDGGLVLYSVGRDRKDDGGRPMDEEKHEGDLVFRLK
ncbi:MAG TPA: hypothetical protein VFG68_15815 [Fimbriiglobus sp.]|nr:hypothetical protein [Fimbriiglobus sp.]